MRILADLVAIGASWPEANEAALLPTGTISTWADRYPEFDAELVRLQAQYKAQRMDRFRAMVSDWAITIDRVKP